MPGTRPGMTSKRMALAMDKRRLGQSDLHFAPIMLGGNVFGWTIDEPTSFKILDAFVDAGFNAVDTSDSYARWVPGNPGGESETIIGNWIKRSGKRDQVLIATKVGEDMGEGRSLKKDYILRECEASLRRLQTDRIDLYQTHFDDEVTPPEETMQAYARLIAGGKVRAIGASNMSPARLKASLAASKTLGLPRYESLQPLYNLSDRKEFETEFLPICQQANLGVINYYSLAAGFLTGKYRSPEEGAKHPGRGGRLKRYLDARGMRILKVLDEVAARHAALPAQVALAWLIAKPFITAPIVSATSLKQLGEILKAPQTRLSRDDIAALDASGT
jgi:aryl-alcohol dehydrogenase-like predicted oxidoreductase